MDRARKIECDHTPTIAAIAASDDQTVGLGLTFTRPMTLGVTTVIVQASDLSSETNDDEPPFEASSANR
jgi:hypothetical protein